MKYLAMNMARVLIVLLVLSSSSIVSGQLSESASISILTIRPGDEVQNAFAHTGIRVVDPDLGFDHVYNYGLYSFSEPNFLMKFLQGKLPYLLGREEVNRFVYPYTRSKRSVIEQHLDLSPAAKNALNEALLENYKPENRKYLYDFFFDNCSTRPRDLLVKSVPDLQFPNQPSTALTFRKLLDVHIQYMPWTDFGMDLLVGYIGDKQASVTDQMFLPEFFSSHLANSSVAGKPLVGETNILLDHEAEIPRRSQIGFFTPLLLFGILMILELFLFLRKHRSAARWPRYYDKVWFFLMGIGSVVLIVMWFGTDHVVTKGNMNILWMNPLFILLAIRPQSRFIMMAVSALLCLAVIQTLFLQQFHAATYFIIVILLLKLARTQRPKSSLEKAAT